MKSRKKYFCILLVLMLHLSFLIGAMEVGAAKSMKKQEQKIEITVKTATDEIANQIDSYLGKEKGVSLKVKGDKKTADKKVLSLREKIKAVNRYGVVFQHDGGKKNKDFYEYNISRENAKLYNLSVRFVKKLHTKLLRKYKSEESETDYNVKISIYRLKKKDYEKFMDTKALKLHIIYDYLVKCCSNEVETTGYTQRSTNDVYSPRLTSEYIVSCVDDSEFAFEVIQKSWQEDSVLLKSYEEFLSDIKDVDHFLSKFEFRKSEPYQYADYLILTNNFYELSDAVKIYAINQSKFFSTDENARLGMQYDGFCSSEEYPDYGSDSKIMKLLLENEAFGVCHHYALSEKTLFEQLGMKVFYVSKQELNHAFTVVKAENSEGKVLWIPFDYGIGPAKALMYTKEEIRQKYLDTEEKRYQYYLSGIKGAPDYKNFTDTDFK